MVSRWGLVFLLCSVMGRSANAQAFPAFKTQIAYVPSDGSPNTCRDPAVGSDDGTYTQGDDWSCHMSRGTISGQTLNLEGNFGPWGPGTGPFPTTALNDPYALTRAPVLANPAAWVKASNIALPVGSNGVCLEGFFNLQQFEGLFELGDYFERPDPSPDVFVRQLGAPLFRLEGPTASVVVELVEVNRTRFSEVSPGASLGIPGNYSSYPYTGTVRVTSSSGSVTLPLVSSASGPLYRNVRRRFSIEDSLESGSAFANRFVSVCVDNAGISVVIGNLHQPRGAQIRNLATLVAAGPSSVITDLIAAGSALTLSIGGRDGSPFGFPGTLDEIRMWNAFRAPAVASADAYTEHSGFEPNLLHYWNFNNATSPLSDLVPSGGISLVAQGAVQYSPSRIPFTKMRKQLSFGRTFDLDAAVAFPTPISGNALGILPAFSMTRNITDASVGAPRGFTVARISDSQLRYSFSGLAREVCGVANTVTVSWDVVPDTTWPPVFAEVAYGSGLAPTVAGAGTSQGGPFNATSVILLPTTGGRVFVSGANFGPSVSVLPTELVTLSTNPNPSLNISVDQLTVLSESVVRFDVSPGVGTGYVGSLALCSASLLDAFRFAYEPPTIATIFGADASLTELIVEGTNFGPFQSAIVVSMDFGGNDTRPCALTASSTFVPHTRLSCTTPTGKTPEQLGSANISVTVRGQSVFFGAVGVRLTTGAAVAEDSASAASDATTLPLIIGLAAAGAVILIFLVVVFILYKKRGGSNRRFVVTPVDKKDFSKIIFGDQLTESVPKVEGDITALEALLMEDDLKLAHEIVRIIGITESDAVAKALVVVFQDNNRVFALLKDFIDKEVAATESAGTLFRSNSMASKMFKFYSRLIGLPYLYQAIAPEITSIVEENVGLEVDPEKLSDDGDIDEMRWLLMGQCQKVLRQILQCKAWPGQFAELFGHVKTSVEGRFPDAVNTTLGGFIFLRFFCPAISSPDVNGIIDEPPSDSSRRLLILITKVLQNLSNDIEFGSKEPYMAKMNDFIQSNQGKLAAFYAQLITPGVTSDVPVLLPKHIKALSMAVLSQQLHDNLGEVNPELRQRLNGLV